MPEDVSVEDVEQLHIDSWKLGLKAVAIYRDNCKVAQPLSMAKKDGADKEKVVATTVPAGAVTTTAPELVPEIVLPVGAVRRELPKIRNSKTFSFRLADSKGYFTVGEFSDGMPGELFISTAKMGSTLRGLMDAFAISISNGLQYGVPLKNYVRAFSHMSFAPSGITDDPEVQTASSIVDYIFRRLALTYLSFDDRLELGLASLDDMPEEQTSLLDSINEPTDAEANVPAAQEPVKVVKASTGPVEHIVIKKDAPAPSDKPKSVAKDSSAPLCYNCGNITQKAGSCYVCSACGSTTGCS
jgi:ribonucleoside-diphosphate reductase alpha chain